MKKNFVFLFFLIPSIIITSIFLVNFTDSEAQRERTLTSLSEGIDTFVKAGKYECCIEPPCTMCYLGEWIWKDGSCKCDEMMRNGEDDKVCPQCKKGLEEGRCKSLQGTCKI